MRITNTMISTTLNANLSASAERAYSAQSQVSSGKKITRASDDPGGAGRALALRSSASGIEQYEKNVKEAVPQLQRADSALDGMVKALQEAKRLALNGATATASPEQRSTLAEQVSQQIEIIVKEINVTHLDRPLFGGFNTDVPPMAPDTTGPLPYKYQGDDGIRRVPVSDTTSVEISMTAKDILNLEGKVDPSQPDTLSILVGLKDALLANDQGAIQEKLKQVDISTQNTIALRGKVGNRVRQLETFGEGLADAKLLVTDQLDGVESADLAEALTKLQTEQNAYQASLIAASRMIQPSLADYLR
jgi:flagellar hook-associated protein 3 FlgL